MTQIITELLLISLCLSIVINSWKIACEEDMIFHPLWKWLDSKFRNYDKIGSKWRNHQGLLYIAKPLYHCVSCMPSIWSLPLLFFFPAWKVGIVAVFSVYISTYLYNRIN